MAVQNEAQRQSVAIIGSGVSSLTAAWLLHEHCDVVIYEKDSVWGGHGHTVDANIDGETVPIDMAVQAIAPPTWSNLLAALTLPRFQSVRLSETPVTIFAVTRGNKVPVYWGNTVEYQQRPDVAQMWTPELRDEATRFTLLTQYMSEEFGDQVLGEWLTANGFSDTFKHAVLIPLLSVFDVTRNGLLNSQFNQVEQIFPGQLSFANGATWFRYVDGVRSFLTALTDGFVDKIKTNHQVTEIATLADGKVQLSLADAAEQPEPFDAVISGADLTVVRTLLDNSANRCRTQQLEYLRPFSSEDAVVYLHRDQEILPEGIPHNSATVFDDTRQQAPGPLMSYNVGSLQGREFSPPVWVTLFGEKPKHSPGALLAEPMSWLHPERSPAISAAQTRLHNIQGAVDNGALKSNVWFCGAGTLVDGYESCFATGIAVAMKVCPQVNYPFDKSSPTGAAAWAEYQAMLGMVNFFGDQT